MNKNLLKLYTKNPYQKKRKNKKELHSLSEAVKDGFQAASPIEVVNFIDNGNEA